MFADTGDVGRWAVDDVLPTDVNFNLSQYMINKRRQHRPTALAVNSSSSSRRRPDVLLDDLAQRNTWELTHRSPARLITADALNRQQLGPADEPRDDDDDDDEDVWIPRFDEHNTTTSQRHLTRRVDVAFNSANTSTGAKLNTTRS